MQDVFSNNYEPKDIGLLFTQMLDQPYKNYSACRQIS